MFDFSYCRYVRVQYFSEPYVTNRQYKKKLAMKNSYENCALFKREKHSHNENH